MSVENIIISCDSCALYQAEMSFVVNDKYCTVEKMEHSRLIDIYEGGKITHYVYNFFLDFSFFYSVFNEELHLKSRYLYRIYI